MPFGDGTGPRGMGPMTGRGAGYCAGFDQLGFANPIPGRRWFGSGWGRPYGYPYVGWGRGMGMGRGMGRGRGWRRFVPYW